MAFVSRSSAVKLGLSCLVLAVVSTPAQAATFISTVVASGLNNPRDVAFGPDGALYIAEAGFPDPSMPTNYLNNGSVTRLYNGVQTRIYTGLSSVMGPMGDISGPQGIAFDAAGNGYLAVGVGANPATRPPGSLLGHVLTSAGGGSIFTDVSAFEAAFNPAGGPVDSNPFHMAAGNGTLYVTDAGGNALYSLGADGSVNLEVVLPGRFIGPPVPVSDFVPTGVTVGPDGTVYISQLTGFPFTPGAAQIYSYVPGSGTVDVFSTGYTNLTDVAFGPDGSLYALSFDTDSLLGPGTAGALYQVSSTGVATNIFSGLTNPTGLTVGDNGKIYVTNFSAGPQGSGELLEISAVPEPATWGMLLLGFGAIGTLVRRRRANVSVSYA